MSSVSISLRSCWFVGVCGWFSNSICGRFSGISFPTGGRLGVAFLCGLSVDEVDGGPMGGIIVCMSGGILGEVNVGTGDCAFLCISRPGGLGGGPGCGGGM